MATTHSFRAHRRAPDAGRGGQISVDPICSQSIGIPTTETAKHLNVLKQRTCVSRRNKKYIKKKAIKKNKENIKHESRRHPQEGARRVSRRLAAGWPWDREVGL